jgi:putative acyl-CoA dehydrogenase
MSATTLPPAGTHEVLNQPPPLAAWNPYDGDRVLVAALHREGGGWAEERARKLAAEIGTARVQELARLANRHTPRLHTHDRFGHRVDRVEYHPAWHELMALAYGHEVHSLAWTAGRPGAQVARAALSYLWNQAENGVGCPTAMSFGAKPALDAAPEIAAEWLPRLLSARYDPRPIAAEAKSGCTIGMTFTEKQGGSDLRANETRARPLGKPGPGQPYALTGHKWFCSAPMSDCFVTLAYTDAEKGPSAFFLRRWRPDGTANPFFIQRLKDKCGNRSNASSEIELDGTEARLIGEEGRGVRVAISMAHLTRLDFAVASAAMMRLALTLALHHTASRRAFQRALVDQPLMRNVLADLALESEAAATLVFRLARAADGAAAGNEHERLLERLATPVAKYWVCRMALAFTAEAMECHGGNGFIEEAPLARLYREAPLNNIWEGSGNVICLDVLRVLEREPQATEAFLAEVGKARGADRRLDRFVGALETLLRDPAARAHNARRLCEAMALALEAALLVRHAPAEIADAFCASRLAGERRGTFGTLAPDLALAKIVERARVAQ